MLDRVETKQSGGYFKEKLTITKSKITGDTLTTAIQKATSHMLKAPKEKHVQYLIACSFGRTHSISRGGMSREEYIVRELEKRVHAHNWVVVLKALVVFHRLLNEAAVRLVRTICANPTLFQTAALKEMADSPLALRQCRLIQRYMRYLEERQRVLYVYVSSADNEDDTVDFRGLEERTGSMSSLAFSSALIGQLEALAEVEYDEVTVDNFCTMECYELLLRDGKLFLQLLSKRMIVTLREFATMGGDARQNWLGLYKRYDEVVRRVKFLFDAMASSTRVFSEPIPRLQLLPERTLRTLEESVYAAEPPAEVATLAQLGIASTESPRRETEEELGGDHVKGRDDEEQRGLPRAASSPPLDEGAIVPHTTQQQTVAKPSVDLDELFSAPAPQQQAASGVALSSIVTQTPPPPQRSVIDDLFTVSPPAADPCGVTAAMPVGVWATVVPNQPWSSGAPQVSPSLYMPPQV